MIRERKLDRERKPRSKLIIKTGIIQWLQRREILKELMEILEESLNKERIRIIVRKSQEK